MAKEKEHKTKQQQQYGLDSEAKILYSKIAKSMIDALLQATDKNGMTHWDLVHEKHGIEVYRSVVGSICPCNSHAVCMYDAKMDDIMDAIVTDTTDEFRKMMRQLDNNFIDGRVIHVIIPRTKGNPHRFVGIKWAAFKSAFKAKDYLYLEVRRAAEVSYRNLTRVS